MREIIHDWIIQNIGASIIIAVCLIAILIYVVRFFEKARTILKFTTKLPCEKNTEKLHEIEKDYVVKSELPCMKNTEDITSLKTPLMYLDKIVNNMTTQINKLQTNGLTRSESPLKITDRGNEMIKRLKLDENLNANWEKINSLIDNGIKEKNAYDINEFCIQQAVVYPNRFLSEDMLSKIKNDAYSQGLDITEYMKVVAVMSRDRFFKEHSITVDS